MLEEISNFNMLIVIAAKTFYSLRATVGQHSLRICYIIYTTLNSTL